jgi:hypothetical protein
VLYASCRGILNQAGCTCERVAVECDVHCSSAAGAAESGLHPAARLGHQQVASVRTGHLCVLVKLT